MMYKRISFLLISCCQLASVLTAQEKISKDAFEKAVDYVNCKFAEFSLQNAASSNRKEYDFFSKSCNCNENPDFTMIKKAIPVELTKNIALASEIDKYKAEYKSDMDVQTALTKIMTEMLANEKKYKIIFEFNRKNEVDQVFIKLKDHLKGRVSEILKGAPKPAVKDPAHLPAVDQNTADMMSEPPLPPDNEDVNSSTLLPYVLVFLCSLIVSLFLFFFLGIPIIQKKTQALLDQERKERLLGLSGSENKLYSIESLYNQLHGEFQILKRDLVTAKRNEQTSAPSPAVTPSSPMPAEEIFYFSSPNREGAFVVMNGSLTFREGNSIYKLIKTGPNRARFRIDDRTIAVTLALRDSDAYIKPVCTAENEFDARFTRITTIKEGIADLDGDKWVVRSNDKAIIKYEA